jgi:branched-chain amino acid transport system permease protein
MTDFIQFLVAGMSQGAIYGLIAIGYSVIYRATGIVNFAHGEFVMLGGLGTAGIIAAGVPPLLAAALALGVALAAAAALDRILVTLSRSAPVILLIIVTIGASIAIRGAAQVVWGRNFFSIPTIVPSEPIKVAGVAVMPQVLLILAVAVVIVCALDQFFRRARFGKAMVAAAINPTAASLVGIELRRVYLVTFLFAGALGALAGLLITPLSLIQFESGLTLGLKGFAAAILGGFGNVMGAFVGGVLLGVAESLGAGYVSSAYKDAIAYVLLVLVLLLKPEGFFGKSVNARV